MPEGPLSGITVVECSIWMLGPLAGVMLGDLGADVIKIENPHSPDGSRNLVSGRRLGPRTPRRQELHVRGGQPQQARCRH